MEENQGILIALAKGYNGFFCPETRFHLIGGMNPQAYYPADLPLSDSMKRGLRGGILLDVEGVIPREDLGLQGVPVSVDTRRETSVSLHPETLEPVEAGLLTFDQVLSAAPEVQTESVVDTDEVVAVDADADLMGFTTLTDQEIDDSGLKELLEFIKTNEIEMSELGLNSRSKLEEVRAALKKKFAV